MDTIKTTRRWAILLGLVVLLPSATGCCGFPLGGRPDPIPPSPPPLGYSVDAIFKVQESNGEATDFVLYEHEFVRGDTVRLNSAGEDHLTQIAARLNEGAHYPVIIERSRSSVREGTEYEYPVHEDPELDRQRWELVVHALDAMGVPDAERRVVVAPRLSEGYEPFEGEWVYQLFGASSVQGWGNVGGLGVGGLGGFGGFGFGGFGGAGGFGGFGGGFF